MVEKEKLIKFVKKHPNLTTYLMGLGAIGLGASIPSSLAGEIPALPMSIIGGGAIAMTKGEIQAIHDYFERHKGKLKKVI
jgi:hypothetical protein